VVNTRTSLIAPLFGIVLALHLSGCVNLEGTIPDITPTAGPISTSTPAPTGTPVLVPEDATPETATSAAQEASGLTPEQYQQLNGQATGVLADTSKEGVDALVGSLESSAGKPVVIVVYYPCPGDTGVMAWGIGGALVAPSNACGEGDQASLGAALAAVERRAERNGWTAEDYVLFIVQ
jgi:hypothetical protein